MSWFLSLNVVEELLENPEPSGTTFVEDLLELPLTSLPAMMPVNLLLLRFCREITF